MVTTALGAWLLGMGMSISGACPGMVMQQIGSNVLFTPNLTRTVVTHC